MGVEVTRNNLYMMESGEGRPLVLLHGWGMNSHVWEPILPELEKLARVTCVDLPGHGKNSHLPLGLLETAQGLAHALPDKVSGLIQIASTPKFVADKGWQHGLAPDVLANFATNLQTDYQGTVRRFFALQFLGVKSDSRAVNALRERIMQYPASRQALEDGLNILATADFSRMPVKQPTRWILGRLDKLIPASLADALPEMGYKQVSLLNSAAHVPFATHPELFMEHVRAFLDEH